MFQLNKENIDILKEAIVNGQDNFITETLKELHHADIAEFIEQLDFEEGQYIVKVLPHSIAASVLIELDEEERDRLVNSLTSKEIAKILVENIDSDDAADVLAELTTQKKEEVISFIEDAEQASDLLDLLNYDEDTAGGIMAKEYISVNINWAVPHAIREMRKQAEEINEVYTIYVVDDKNRLVGTLSLKKLLFSNSLRSTVADIYNDSQVKSVLVTEDNEDVANIMAKYDLVVLPVLDENGVLLGRITIDDVVDVMQEEAERDYQLASGISQSVESDDKVWRITRARLPWLLIGMVGGVFSSRIIGVYEDAITANPQMAFFIPLIAATGGNVGVQSSAIVVQSLANNSFDAENIRGKLSKELRVALINAFICSTFIFTYDYFFVRDSNLGATVSLSLFAVIICASLFGTLIPMLLNKFKIDPALATGPFITTINDILGLILYFSIGGILFGS
jgi:magnesium transporter